MVLKRARSYWSAQVDNLSIRNNGRNANIYDGSDLLAVVQVVPTNSRKVISGLEIAQPELQPRFGGGFFMFPQ